MFWFYLPDCLCVWIIFSFITYLYFLFYVALCSLYVLCVNLHELFTSRALYFIDLRHAFFQIFTSLKLGYIVQSVAPYISNGQYFFFLFSTESYRAFNNPCHRSQWTVLNLCQPFLFQIVSPVIFWLIFVQCVHPSVFSSLCPSPIFSYSPGRIHSLSHLSFCPEIITKPTFFRFIWPLTLQ